MHIKPGLLDGFPVLVLRANGVQSSVLNAYVLDHKFKLLRLPIFNNLVSRWWLDNIAIFTPKEENES